MTSPRQITLRNPSPELVERLREISRERGKSLNATIIEVLEQAVGVDARREWLQRFATWGEEDVLEFEQHLAEQRKIDEELWR